MAFLPQGQSKLSVIMRCPYKVGVRKTGFDCINEGLLSVSQDIDCGMTALDLLLRYCFISFMTICPSKRSITDLNKRKSLGSPFKRGSSVFNSGLPECLIHFRPCPVTSLRISHLKLKNMTKWQGRSKFSIQLAN